MPGAGELAGKFTGAAEQLFLWGVLSQVVSTAGQPAMTELAAIANTAHPLTRLSPAEAAAALNRSFLDAGSAESEAAAAGIDPGRLATMRLLAGTAPGPQDLAAAVRRGIIPEEGSGPGSTSFTQGIAEGNLLNKWAGMIRQLAEQILSPADAASADVRNFLPSSEAEVTAGKSGVSPADYRVLRHLSADAPAPGQLAEALRRGLIPDGGTGPDSVSFQQGIAEGRLGDKWTAMIRGLAKIWPSPADALRATLEGQVSHEEGRALYERLGGDPQFFTVLLNTQGSAPTPIEALELANRGIIPWEGTGPAATSYHQAFLEGPWRNKWLAAYRELGKYLPPPETVRTLLGTGQITHAQAAALWRKNGLDEETIRAYTDAADFTSTADTRGLSESAVLDLYYAQYLSADDARKLLALFHASPANITLLLAYIDVRRATASVTSAVSRIQSLYAARKIGTQTAREALHRLKIPGGTIDSVIATWEVEASVSVRTLTEAQITSAWQYGIMDQDTAMGELQAIGYTPFDAWTLLSIKAKGPLPGQPARDVAPPPGTVTPGVT